VAVREAVNRPDEFVGALVTLVRQRFNRGLRVLLKEKKPVNVWNCHVRLDVPENLKVGRKKRIAAASSGQ
jgi:hypothetical protein